ncbi:hypothetical protein [Desulfovibrio sp.]|uniref:hypothetical protein n=1 Tax=Desulfovibrio sp. TaxID=885 RepID=UPI0025B8AE91|nr:hypothetical protein [Desulfovibrio sp.]
MLKTKMVAAAFLAMFVAGCSSSPECDSSDGKKYAKKIMQSYAQELGIKDPHISFESFKTTSADKNSCKCVVTAVMGNKSAESATELRYALEFELPETADSRYYIEMIN